MLASVVKNVSGTAGEALENNAYAQMVKKYGDQAAKAIVEHELKSAGETLESFEIYLRVKTKIQNDKISFIRTAKEAEQLAKECVLGF